VAGLWRFDGRGGLRLSAGVNIAELARAIVERETGAATTAVATAQGIQDVFRRLYTLLAAVVGELGFDALMTRALHLSRARNAELAACDATLAPGAVCEGLAAMVERVGEDVARRWAVALLGEILALHCDFIGEDLTLRLLRRVWPEPVDAASSGSEEA
jgi:hypothetical protein